MMKALIREALLEQAEENRRKAKHCICLAAILAMIFLCASIWFGLCVEDELREMRGRVYGDRDGWEEQCTK